MSASLFSKIRQFGYEIEYPLDTGYENEPEEEDGITIYSTLDDIAYHHPDIYSDYGCHEDGGGIEFSTPDPLPYDRYLKEIKHVYQICETLAEKYGTNDDLFDSCDAGVHIRIDVSDWSMPEQLRLVRLFSAEMNQFDDYREWVESYFGRSVYNWNSPVNYEDMRRHIERGYSTGRNNIRYENCRFGNSITMEIRGFCVKDNVHDALRQTKFIKLICDIIQLSLIDKDRSVPVVDKLYNAWMLVRDGNNLINDSTMDSLAINIQ